MKHNKKVGEYIWRQLSMWDFAPKNCIETFVRSDDGKETFHFYLIRVIEIISESHYKTADVPHDEIVPESTLEWRSGKVNFRNIQ